jgi:asparagine synthase (glutamine-hydrolysing)
MCGIAGFVNIKISDPEQALRQMGAALAHRGPDAEGFFAENGCGLMHRRLSIIDLSTSANQPMHSQCGRYVMVYNGEVYNYPAIAEDLQKEKELVFRTRSDSEVILEAFALWGSACVSRFNGMFAIAIYDRQEATLTLMRDRLGIKPLFIFQTGNSLAFASELKALRAIPWIRDHLELKRNSIAAYLHLGYVPGPASIHTAVIKMQPGTTALFREGRLESQTYWEAGKQIRADVITDENQAQDELHSLLRSSVKMRLVSDVPFGTFLSGGIDSSLVTALAQEAHNVPVKTFSIGFEERSHDESPYAKAVAEHLGTLHHEFRVTEKEALELIPQLAAVYDEPYADSSAVPTMLVSRLAKQYVSMSLSGDGGDELFMGYGAYRWAERLDTPLWRGMHKAAALAFSLGNSRQQRIAKMLRFPARGKAAHIFSQEQYLFTQAEVTTLLKEPDDAALLEEQMNALTDFKTARRLQAQEQQALYDLQNYLRDDLLVKVDRASMVYALESRVPLLDYRIAEFAMNLDPSLKFRDGQTKFLLKKILYQYVPAPLFDRPKRGFAVPLAAWLKGPLKPMVMETLAEERIVRAGVVDPSQVTKLLKRFYGGGPEYLYNRIWCLLMLHQSLIP